MPSCAVQATQGLPHPQTKGQWHIQPGSFLTGSAASCWNTHLKGLTAPEVDALISASFQSVMEDFYGAIDP